MGKWLDDTNWDVAAWRGGGELESSGARARSPSSSSGILRIRQNANPFRLLQGRMQRKRCAAAASDYGIRNCREYVLAVVVN